jgi:uracil-DNA glycosylase family 4
VSPYTKGAHALGGIAVVLQDWSSADVLSAGIDSEVQRLGRTPGLRTNRTLELLLQRVLGVSLVEVYVTNIFPFVKPGGISNPVPRRDAERAAREYAQQELALVQPTVVLALGRIPESVLRAVGVECVGLPHPAARIGSFAAHETAWRTALNRG